LTNLQVCYRGAAELPETRRFLENKISTNKAKPEGVKERVGTMGEILKSSYPHSPPPFVVTLAELHC
jgi:hypothetical protein